IFTLWFAMAVVAPANVRAAPTSREMPVSIDQFRALATELAPKVNFFRDVWALDPKAEFFGGTSRDYLYWLKGQLLAARNAEDLAARISRLRALEVIDVKEFIVYESDIDVISKRYFTELDATRYGIKKVDTISAERFDPKTQEGQTELRQGFIPAEKIRLGKNGVGSATAFGDGVREIYDGRLTVSYATETDFWKTHYAQNGQNHPVLLALRYIRLLAMNHFQSHGKGWVSTSALREGLDRSSVTETKRVVEQSLGDRRLEVMLRNEAFARRVNGTIQKAFRSHTNPTATKLLFEAFGADQLVTTFTGIDPINQYLFAVHREPQRIAEAFRQHRIDPTKFFVPVESLLPDGKLHHGTETEGSFRSILFQGILPSSEGSAGSGLYAVPTANRKFAEEWKARADLVVEFDVSPEAKVVDIRSGAGAEAFSRFRAVGSDPYSEFAEKFGIDILIYPYPSFAVVVKNGAVLKNANGAKRKLMKLGALLDHIREQGPKMTLPELVSLIEINGLNTVEIEAVTKQPFMKDLIAPHLKGDVVAAIKNPQLNPRPGFILNFPEAQAALERQLGLDVRKLAVSSKRARSLSNKLPYDVHVSKYITRIIDRQLDAMSNAQLEALSIECVKHNDAYIFYAIAGELGIRAGNDGNGQATYLKEMSSTAYHNPQNEPTIDRAMDEVHRMGPNAVSHATLIAWMDYVEPFRSMWLMEREKKPLQEAERLSIAKRLVEKHGVDFALGMRIPSRDVKYPWSEVDRYLAKEMEIDFNRGPEGKTELWNWFIGDQIARALESAPLEEAVRFVEHAYQVARRTPGNSYAFSEFMFKILLHPKFKHLTVSDLVIADARRRFTMQGMRRFSAHGTEVRQDNYLALLEAVAATVQKKSPLAPPKGVENQAPIATARTCNTLFGR
ncbi:MAG: hypothetical protein V4760_07860, partial [Bdellovibrionota bacterium]